MKNCPICDSESVRVIYYGLPHWLCNDEQCSCLFGLWINVTRYLPFNGVYLQYDCGYFEALWAWLTTSIDDAEGGEE